MINLFLRVILAYVLFGKRLKIRSNRSINWGKIHRDFISDSVVSEDYNTLEIYLSLRSSDRNYLYVFLLSYERYYLLLI